MKRAAVRIIAADGSADMVDVGDKAVTARSATASGAVVMARETLDLILSGNAKKGDVIGTARIAGIMAAKRTHELIPLCHPLALEKIAVDIEPDAALPGLRVTATAKLAGKTGVEMEALTAVSVACLTIYDMAKAADRGMRSPTSGSRRRPAAAPARGGRKREGDEPAPRRRGGRAAARRRRAAAGRERAACRAPRPRARRTISRRCLTQPPFPASAMDGYAVRAAEAQAGRAAQGRRHVARRRALRGALGPGEAVRIFTGAPVPDGADAILIQENAERDGDTISVRRGRSPPAATSAPAGLDFKHGDVAAARRTQCSTPHALSLAASMGHAALPVRRRPRVAILANGDELVPPGASPGRTRSSPRTASALPRSCGEAAARRSTSASRPTAARRSPLSSIAPPAPTSSCHERRRLGRRARPRAGGADGRAAWRSISGRSPCGPGKPLMVGRLGAMRVLGLPGNPVSAFVCAELFLRPLIRAMLGLPTAQDIATAKLGAPMPANDGRQDYVRARLAQTDGGLVATPFPSRIPRCWRRSPRPMR